MWLAIDRRVCDYNGDLLGVSNPRESDVELAVGKNRRRQVEGNFSPTRGESNDSFSCKSLREYPLALSLTKPYPLASDNASRHLYYPVIFPLLLHLPLSLLSHVPLPAAPSAVTVTAGDTGVATTTAAAVVAAADVTGSGGDIFLLGTRILIVSPSLPRAFQPFPSPPPSPSPSPPLV
jgi:hypothetical protein